MFDSSIFFVTSFEAYSIHCKDCFLFAGLGPLGTLSGPACLYCSLAVIFALMWMFSVAGKAVSETTNRQIESVNRERESVATLLFFGFHYRISLSTITFEFRTISVSVSPLIFLQHYRSSPIEIER